MQTEKGNGHGGSQRERIARQEALTLGQIARKVHELHPEALTFSVDRLSVGLRARGLSFKMNRLTLKKNATPSDSRPCKRG
jgi:hypothetical protein